MIGDVLVTSVPCEIVADLRMADCDSTLVNRTLNAVTGPLLVMMIV